MSYHPTVVTITQLLTTHNCWFETFEHRPVTTSVEAAQIRSGYSLAQGAKALIVRIKEKSGQKYFAMLVIPGNLKFDTAKVKDHFTAKDIRFATVAEVSQITAGIEPGGVPPFGNLFELPVVVDNKLLTNDKIIFNAGDRCFSIAMMAANYLELVTPQLADLT